MGSGQSAIEKTKQLGNKYFQQQNYPYAVAAYSKALRYDTKNHFLLSNRCLCNLKLNKLKSALEDAMLCIKAQPNWIKGYFRLATVFQQLGLVAEGYQLLLICISLEPGDQIIQNALNQVNVQNTKAHVFQWDGTFASPLKQIQGIPFTDIACGVSHVIGTTTKGMVFVWGDNSHGQCGVQQEGVIQPTILKDLVGKNVCSVAAGGGHSLAITTEGNMFVWGINAYGQCGLPVGNLSSPQLIKFHVKIQAVAAGLAHTFILTQEGDVFAAGWNNCGQLGINSTKNALSFTEVESLPNIRQISCGAAHSIFVSQDGYLFGVGSNSCGQLGLGHSNDCFIPNRVDSLQQVKVSYAQCGEEYSFVISEDREVYSFGLGNFGQLGNGQNCMLDYPIKVEGLNMQLESIVCSKSQVIGISNTGAAYQWGDFQKIGVPQLPSQINSLRHKRINCIKAMRENFILNLKYTDSQKTYVRNYTLQALKSGQRHKFILDLMDCDNDYVTQQGDLISVVCFSHASDELSQGKWFSYFEDGQWYIEIQLLNTGHHDVYVFCNGDLLPFNPFIVTVVPGDLAYCKGTVAMNSVKDVNGIVSLHAGDWLNLQLISYDRNGNQCTKGGQLIKQDIEILGEELQYSLTDLNDGEYRLSIQFTKAGNSSYKIFVKDQQIQILYQDLEYDLIEKSIRVIDLNISNTLDLIVFPNVLYPQFCKVQMPEQSLFAGQDIVYTILQYDYYQNETYNKPKAYGISIIYNAEQVEYTIEEQMGFTQTLVKFKAIKSGQYNVSVSYNSQKLIDNFITINPGPPYPLNCIVTNFQSSQQVQRNSQFQFSLLMRDIYSNPASGHVDFSIRDDQAKAIQCQIIEESPSERQLQFEVQKFGRMTIYLSINGNSLPGFPKQVLLEQDPQQAMQEEFEKMRQQQLLLEQEQERILQQELLEQRRLQEQQEKTLKAKLQAELQAKEAQLKKQEELEIEKRRRIIERIQKQELTQKRAEESLKLFQQLHSKQNRNLKKWKRIGGGFIVPYNV